MNKYISSVGSDGIIKTNKNIYIGKVNNLLNTLPNTYIFRPDGINIIQFIRSDVVNVTPVSLNGYIQSQLQKRNILVKSVDYVSTYDDIKNGSYKVNVVVGDSTIDAEIYL